MKIEPLIVVKNVKESSQFYQELLDCESGHGGDEYEMLLHQGKLILQLHQHDAHEHPEMWNPGVPPGNGVVLWFRTDNFDECVGRIRDLKAIIVAEPHVNPNALQNEIWLKDPDGYLIVVSNNFGDANLKKGARNA